MNTKCVEPKCNYSNYYKKCIKPNPYIEKISECGRNKIKRKECNFIYNNDKIEASLNACKRYYKRIALKNPKMPSKISHETQAKIDNFIKKRAAKKIQKLTLPFIRRVSANIKDRINHAKLFDKYLKNIDDNQCLVPTNNNQYTIGDKKIKLVKKIGTESKYGVIYNSKGTNEGELFKFAAKIMKIIPENEKEIELLDKFTKIVKNNKNPHFPIMYKKFECLDYVYNDKLPQLINFAKYFIVLNELANGDLNMFMKTSHAREAKYTNNALAQVFLAILSLHSNGYYHKDSHYGNFLFHRITPGGYIKYNIFGKTIYLENVGYLWVIWDFGLCKEIVSYKSIYYFINDYYRIINAFLNKDNLSKSGWIDNEYQISRNTQIIAEYFYSIIRIIDLNLKIKYDLEGEKNLFFSLIYDTDLFITENNLPKNAKIINSEAYKIF